MRILHFIHRDHCPSREMLMDSLRLGEPIMLNINHEFPIGYTAFSAERMRNVAKNGEWLVDFRDSFGGKSNLVYLSTYNKKAFVVNQRFHFPKNGMVLNRSLSHNEIEVLCHLTEFECHELNDRILDCFIGAASFSKKEFDTTEEIKNLVSMKKFKRKAESLIPIVEKLLN